MFAHSRCGKAYPAVFSLLPNKKSKTYEKLWEIIKETINLDMPDKEPLHMLLDFESTFRCPRSGQLKRVRGPHLVRGPGYLC